MASSLHRDYRDLCGQIMWRVHCGLHPSLRFSLFLETACTGPGRLDDIEVGRPPREREIR